MGHGMHLSGSGRGQVAGTCECGNEHSGSIKYGKFLASGEPLASQEGLYCMD